MFANSICRVAVFGATGKTGSCAVERALRNGSQVTALVREGSASRLPSELADKIAVVTGDSRVMDDVAKVIHGQDAVIVCLGTRDDLSFTTAMSDSLKLILDAMCQERVKKISVCLSAFLFWEPDRVPARFAEVTADHRRMLDLLQSPNYSELEWVAVCPPHITEESTGKDDGQFQVVHGSVPGRQITKWDLGQFLFDCLSQPEHYHEMCGLGYPAVPK